MIRWRVHLGVEVTDRVSAHQQQFIDEIAARGGVAFVARSVEEVMKAIEDFLLRATPASPSSIGISNRNTEPVPRVLVSCF